jgi:hypothetical protein
MELQFYPPGWTPFIVGTSCDPTKWCAAVAIFGLSDNMTQTNNADCLNRAGEEFANFAFLTKSGTPQAPPNPLGVTAATFTPGADVLYMNPGDDVSVSIHDSEAGLVTSITDSTTGETGSMTASAENGFAHPLFEPTASTCTEEPYGFHPMYSTSSEHTRVPWAAHSYNVAFSDEIGHFDFCSHISANTGSCDGQEGIPGDLENADGDDNFCFPSELSLMYPATGCVDSNAPGFDGVSYQDYWPNGSPTRPTPILFSSPKTGTAYTVPYPQLAFEADLPRIEAADLGGNCQRLTTGANCVNPPNSDEGTPAAFYPYYSSVSTANGPATCSYGIGSTLPNTVDNFGGSSTAEFGPLFRYTVWTFGGHGATNQRFNNFNSGPLRNNC